MPDDAPAPVAPSRIFIQGETYTHEDGRVLVALLDPDTHGIAAFGARGQRQFLHDAHDGQGPRPMATQFPYRIETADYREAFAREVAEREAAGDIAEANVRRDIAEKERRVLAAREVPGPRPGGNGHGPGFNRMRRPMR